jgi:hypothetical protein
MRKPLLLLVMVSAGLVGCPGMSPKDNAKFQARIAQQVSAGMPVVTSIERLVKAGYRCDDRSSAPLITCARYRFSLLPYTCIERVSLTADTGRQTVIAVSPKPIICAGL